MMEKNFEQFGKDVFEALKEYCIEECFEIELEELLGIAKKHSLVKYLPYDPEIHGDIQTVDKGVNIWWWGD
jgi:hypothetical protein